MKKDSLSSPITATPTPISVLSDMQDCTLCPRECHVDRASGQTGFCGQTDRIVAARAALHFWEEPCLSSSGGSGTVFFSGCNLRCIYCQNHTIARGQMGKAITTGRLSEIFLELQDKGAHNINLVTPTHFVPQIIEALQTAKANGLTLPVIYNTSGYEKIETLKRLEGLIDIYLPDLKYHDTALSSRYSNAPDYFTRACAAIGEMFRQTGRPVFVDDEDSLMLKGVIVRHLLLPDCEADSRYLLRYLHRAYGNDIYVSIMNQYTPMEQAASIPSLNRRISPEEYERIVDYAIHIGIENGFIQEGETASESFIPAFDCEGI